jgi:hypothetical protein
VFKVQKLNICGGIWTKFSLILRRILYIKAERPAGEKGRGSGGGKFSPAPFGLSPPSAGTGSFFSATGGAFFPAQIFFVSREFGMRRNYSRLAQPTRPRASQRNSLFAF